MLNILILAAGNLDSNPAEVPSCLIEVSGMPLLQLVTEKSQQIPNTKITYIIKHQDVKKFNLDNVCKILDKNCHTLILKNVTRGAACSALLAQEFIDNTNELLILNTNEYINIDFQEVINHFRKNNWDAGTIIFPSIHPRYSYVRLNNEGLVVEAAEKRPISKHATAGFYWFKNSKDFIESAKSMILKQASIENNYYICPTLNEMILKDKKIGVHTINASDYKPIKKAY